MVDLEEAIRNAQQAVEVTPQDHPGLASRLNNLGTKLVLRFERTGRMKDLGETIHNAQRVNWEHKQATGRAIDWDCVSLRITEMLI